MENIWRVVSWEKGGERIGAKVQGLRSINGRYKIGKGVLRTV